MSVVVFSAFNPQKRIVRQVHQQSYIPHKIYSVCFTTEYFGDLESMAS